MKHQYKSLCADRTRMSLLTNRNFVVVAFALIGYQVESALFEIEGIDSSPIQSSFIFEATLCNFQSKHIKNWQDRKRIVITC